MAVCAADVRGVGDLEPQFSPGAAGHARAHQHEEDYAWASLILGRGLLGQRVTDIMALVQALAQAYPQSPIMVAARDKMTVPALCAAALEPRISKLYLARHLVSWRSLVESENYSYPLANFVPNILRVTDIEHFHWSLTDADFPSEVALDDRPVSLAAAVELVLIEKDIPG